MYNIRNNFIFLEFLTWILYIRLNWLNNLKKFYIYFILYYKYIVLTRLFYQIFMLKKIIYLSLIKKNNIKKKKKIIKKGIKLKNLGIYSRNFLLNKYDSEDIDNIILKEKICYLIMRFKRKNLFLTLLNNNGDVLSKTNIGSCGFKKKVKFTGYAIKRTSRYFSERILGSFIKNMYIIRKICKKKMYKIKDLLYKYNNKYSNIYNKFFISKKKKKNIKKKNIKLLLNNKMFTVYNKEYIWDIITKKKLVKKYINYRRYPYNIKVIKENFKVILRIKSNLKFWGFKFVIYGLAKKFGWFSGIDIRLPIPHSDGLRLKKKRRV